MVRSECGNEISNANFLTVFHSNYGSVWLSFRDMTTGLADRRRTDVGYRHICGPVDGLAIISLSIHVGYKKRSLLISV